MKKEKIGAILLVLILTAGFITLSGCVEEEDEEIIGIQSTRSEIMIFWDPSDSFSNEIIAMHNIYETLLRYDPLEDELEGVLAEDWSSSEDGLTWTFELKEGVEFHTGGEMTAEDVKFSIERTIDRGRGASFIWGPLEEIEIVDDYTVRFNLNEPAPIDLIAASSYGSFIFSKQQADEVDDLHEWFNDENSAGTGPYVPESWEREERLVMTRFDDYWQGWDSDEKKFDRVVIRNIPEATT
ncbi:MAG: ABC transporter substrate-binding protein, partial [Candidatus Saliniplasma sp.]